jgi:hypothetical protein
MLSRAKTGAAMQPGISDRPWSLDDVVTLIDHLDCRDASG